MTVLCDKDIALLCKTDSPLITGYYDWEWQLQPAGFDMSVNKIFSLESVGTIHAGRKENKLAGRKEISCDDEQIFYLSKGYYLVQFCETLHLPNNIVAFAKPRSTLLRYGGTLETGIWDPGFHGISQCGLVVFNEVGLKLEKGASLLHIAFLLLSGESDGFQHNSLHKAIIGN